jgi:hypothetical protein
MKYIRWNGKKWYLPKPKKYEADINELMKPLGEKAFKGNIWGSVITNVYKEAESGPPPTPSVTPSNTPTSTPTSTPPVTPSYTPSPTPVSYLLDLYSADAYGAYSLRKLSSTYLGDAIRVRRDLDNAETDIGFVGEDLDISTLTTFMAGSVRGYITTWYDQTGVSADMVQSTALRQAVIYDSGAVLVDGNGKARAQFNGNAGNNNPSFYNAYLPNSIATGNTAVFAIAERTTTTGADFALWTASDPLFNGVAYNQHTPLLVAELNNVANTFGTFDNWITYTGNISVSQSPDSVNVPFIGGYDRSGTTVTITSVSTNVDVSTVGTQTWISSTTGGNVMSMGLSGTIAGANAWAGYYQELVVYKQSKTTSASGIKTNMNSYYNVY